MHPTMVVRWRREGRGEEASLCCGDVWVKIEGRRSDGERALGTGALSVGWEREVRWVG